MSTDRQQTNQIKYEPTSSGAGDGVEPSGPEGDNPATAGPGPTTVTSNTPENAKGHINPSSPEDANTTPGTAGQNQK
jgi:hypothetical protein